MATPGATTAVSVVLPAYNEARNLQPLLPRISDVLDGLERGPCEVLVVDDGSTDDTAAVAHAAAQGSDRIRVVELQSNFGQSAALAAGIDHARGDIIVPMDADGQNDPGDIPRLLAELNAGADCVSGWRRDRDDPLGKRIPSAIQTRLAKWTGPDIHDFGCTLTAYRADAIRELDLRGERHRYIPARLHDLGYDVTEVEVEHHPREHGDSHYGVGRLVRGFVDLVYNLFRVRYGARPMHVFGGLGLLMLGAGILLGVSLVAGKFLFGVELIPRLPRLLLSISLTGFGLGLFSLGLVTEMLTEILWDGERAYRVQRVIE